MLHLPQRLKSIADTLPPGYRVADIGLDHALLAVYLVNKGISSGVIGVENQSGPYNKALDTVNRNGLGERIDIRFGSGLGPLYDHEVDQVVIAGMGGETITGILAADPEKAHSYPYYVFQPMTKAESLRSFLAGQGWPIRQEKVLCEKRRFYTLIQASPGSEPYRLTDLEKALGPLILRQNNETARAYKRFMLNKYRRTLKGLRSSRQKPHDAQMNDIINQIHALEAFLDVLEC